MNGRRCQRAGRGIAVGFVTPDPELAAVSAPHVLAAAGYSIAFRRHGVEGRAVLSSHQRAGFKTEVERLAVSPAALKSAAILSPVRAAAVGPASIRLWRHRFAC